MNSSDIDKDMIFIAVDGDGIGKKVGRAVIANDVDELHKISARIDAAQDFIMHWAKQNDGVKISGGGDEATLAIPKEAGSQIESLRKDVEHAFGFTISVGIGKDLAEAGTSLLVAKLRGKNQIVHYNDDLQKEIKKAKRRVRENRATPDEYKLAEAYLKKQEELAKAGSMDKKETGHEKGVHVSDTAPRVNSAKRTLEDTSKMGRFVDSAKEWKESGQRTGHTSVGDIAEKINTDRAKNEAKKVLAEQKHIKPNLPKSEDVCKCEKCGRMYKKETHERGVHQPASHPSGGRSEMGEQARGTSFYEAPSGKRTNLSMPSAKLSAKTKLAEIKNIHPNLPKSEDIGKAEELEDQECEYCNQTDGVDPDHCKYCHDVQGGEGEENCPYCQQVAQSDDCPYCQESEDADSCPYCEGTKAQAADTPEVGELDDHVAQQNPKIQSPDSNNASAPAGSEEEKEQANQMGMNPPVIGKPEQGNSSSPCGIGQANPMDNTCGAPVTPDQVGPEETEAGDMVMPEEGETVIPEEGAHSKEALHAIAEKIEGETPEGETEDKEAAKQVDDTEVVGDEMEGNVSRPDNFDTATPGDVGMDGESPTAQPQDEREGTNEGEESVEQEEASQEEPGQEAEAEEDEEPELASVLQEGLDSESDEIQKEKVRTMIGQALEGFKANKQILENAKEQAPDFYNASIAMLAAMIHMADLLGLRGRSEEVAEDEWHDPFPTHPDQGGEAKPVHSAAQGDAEEPPQQ